MKTVQRTLLECPLCGTAYSTISLHPMHGEWCLLGNINTYIVEEKPSSKPKLKDAEVITIREMHLSQKYKHKEIASMFNVSRSTIISVIKGYNYKHLLPIDYHARRKAAVKYAYVDPRKKLAA